MNKIVILFFAYFLLAQISFAQTSENDSDHYIDPNAELTQKIEELNKLYNILKNQVDQSNSQLDNQVQDINSRLAQFSENINTSYSKIDNRTGSIEGKLKISETEKRKNFTTSVERNIEVQENFSQYIKFYGDKYSQLDEKVTSEELALELRKIVNPQSGSLGFKLSDTLNNVLSKNLMTLVDQIIVDKKATKEAVKEKVNNTVSVMTSILDNKTVTDIVGIIPYGTNIKNMIGTVSGLVVNLFDKKSVKKEFQENFTTKISEYQNNVISDLRPILSFYDNIAKLDNDYQITLQTIRNDVDILGIELKEFCMAMEVPLQKVSPSLSINKNDKLREITIEIADIFENLKNDKDLNKKNLGILTNISLEIKNRSRDLFNRYREIQENKINANNEFVNEFKKVVEDSKITLNTNYVTKKLNDKNMELLEKMESNHAIDKTEFEKYLNKISELN